ncbi:hypothetical protein M6B38_334050 [Iris pallida]|uniref:Uncharacterized protein n=1 Tax=Iris pallida TaxID=29817 RepID=A0AAX6H1U1_IRIPA|nr:hypothetical protein M6B38_334050 [Iris pallida]
MRLSERTRGRSWGSYRGRRGRCWRGRGGGEGGGLGISNFIEEAVQYDVIQTISEMPFFVCIFWLISRKSSASTQELCPTR